MKYNTGLWNKEINVRDFIQRNYTPYYGDDAFLCAPTARTVSLWEKLSAMMKIERERNGVYDIDAKTIHVELSDEEIAARLKNVKRPDHPAPGVLRAYRRGVSGSETGALWLYDKEN